MRLIILGVIALLSTAICNATTILIQGRQWKPSKVVCPVCGIENTFQELVQTAGRESSKEKECGFLFLFWPDIDEKSIYQCTNCGFASLVINFSHYPVEILEKIKLLKQSKGDKALPSDYLKISTCDRIIAAESYYQLWRTENEFWSKFYRLQAYHCTENSTMQQQALRNALTYTEKMELNPIESMSLKKQLIIRAGILAEMKRLKEAREILGEAKKLTYIAGKDNSKLNSKIDSELNHIIEGFIKLIDAPAPLPLPKPPAPR